MKHRRIINYAIFKKKTSFQLYPIKVPMYNVYLTVYAVNSSHSSQSRLRCGTGAVGIRLKVNSWICKLKSQTLGRQLLLRVKHGQDKDRRRNWRNICFDQNNYFGFFHIGCWLSHCSEWLSYFIDKAYIVFSLINKFGYTRNTYSLLISLNMNIVKVNLSKNGLSLTNITKYYISKKIQCR